MYCEYASSCVVSGCSFTQCESSSGYGGGLCLYYISACTLVKNSTFDNCTVYYGGGGLGIYYSNVTQSACDEGVSGGIVSGCSFTLCASTASSYDGGGVHLNQISVSPIHSCSFTSCHSSNNGGGLNWGYPTDEQLTLTTWIYDCVFELNLASSNGHDVYINSNDTDRSTSIFDSLSYTATNQEKRVMWKSTNRDSWLPYRVAFDGIVYLDPSLTSSSSSCGLNATPCSSLRESIESSLYRDTVFKCVALMEGVHKNDVQIISIGENTLPIQNNGTVEFDVPSSFSSTSSVFEISTGTLNMTGLASDYFTIR